MQIDLSWQEAKMIRDALYDFIDNWADSSEVDFPLARAIAQRIEDLAESNGINLDDTGEGEAT